MNILLHVASGVVFPIIASGICLYFSLAAWSRLKWIEFKMWGTASALSLFGQITLVVIQYGRTNLSESTHHLIWVAWCLGYLASTVLGTAGTVLLVRRLLGRAETLKPAPSNLESQ